MDEHVRRLTIAAAALALALGAAGATAAAGTTFPDPVGDVQGGAGPDITAVSVSHTASTVTFRFRFAQKPPLGTSVKGRWADMLLLGIDVPPRGLMRTRFGWMGLDFYAGLHGNERTAMLVKAVPATPGQGRVTARPAVAVAGRTLSFSIRRSDLGNPAWIEFVVVAGREAAAEAAGGGDEAPTYGVFHYGLG